MQKLNNTLWHVCLQKLPRKNRVIFNHTAALLKANVLYRFTNVLIIDGYCIIRFLTDIEISRTPFEMIGYSYHIYFSVL